MNNFDQQLAQRRQILAIHQKANRNLAIAIAILSIALALQLIALAILACKIL